MTKAGETVPEVTPSTSANEPELPWLVGLCVAAGLILTFGWLAEEVFEGDTTAFDRHILLLFRRSGDPGQLLGPDWLPEMLRDLTSLGSTVILGLVLVVALGYLAMARKRGALALVLVSVLGGQAIATVLKLVFARPRPDLVPNAPMVFTASFPSGHAMLSAITYLTLGALLARIEKRCTLQHYFMITAIALTILVGVSRVALGVHWPTDVLAGWCVGAAWAIGCATAAGWLVRRRKVERID